MIFSKKSKDRGVETLRQPDRNPRCYELTEQEKLAKISEWQKNDVWNFKQVSKHNQPQY